ncbi:MAG TPA: Crp/Fnr family transcriptional regulator [Chitinophagaceae bacterium]|nr:Crp/Fnr family transcriptional regulator [Chitinophagaceae bacterium]HNF71145.1 Crp/Fnr family transcriptional regulator [Chitinophagaceae bacterium]
MEPSIRQYITDYVDPRFKKEEDLPFPTFIQSLAKHTIITEVGTVERFGYYLKEGIVKISMLRDGEERILEFFFPGSFFCSYTSFLSQQPSEVWVEALTDCVVEVLRYDDMQKAYSHSIIANKMGRIITEYYYIRKTEREKSFLTDSAPERYKKLMEYRPELVQQIPVKMIAQYLGIQPESLSRIRKELSKTGHEH